MRYLMLLFAFPAVATAAPVDALKPMAFLAGYCWKGEFPGGKQTDEHCFTWLYDGRALRDTHGTRAFWYQTTLKTAIAKSAARPALRFRTKGVRAFTLKRACAVRMNLRSLSV